MIDKEYVCEDCDAEFDVDYDFVATPEFCPFCGSKLTYDDKDLDDEDWEEDESDQRGC
jgi:DNA-directed RNA polymerase subunit RPC12/RpoP